IEKILARQSGGALQPLSEQTAFAADYQARFRNALAYGWVHFKPISDVLSRLASDAGDKNKDSDSPDPSKIISAAGLTGLKTISFGLNATSEGSFGEFHLGVPAASRVGIFKIISAEPNHTVTSSTLLGPMLGQSGGKEREFLGRKIYSVTLPGGLRPDGSMVQNMMSYAAGGGYLAMSTDDAMLETFLRSGDNTGKGLRDTAGLADAAQKIGGMSTGLFGYQNTSETVRATLESLKNDSGTLGKVLAITPFGAKLNGKDGKG